MLEIQQRKCDISLCHFKILISGRKSFSEMHRLSIFTPKGDYIKFFMSRQALSWDAGSGQLCGEPASSACVPACGKAVWTKSAGSLLGSHSEEQLTISTVIWDSSSLSTRLGGEMDKSGDESLARSCKWSWSQPGSVLTLLHNPHRLCRVSSRFCSSSVCSCSKRSFSLFCRDNDGKAHLFLFMVYWDILSLVLIVLIFIQKSPCIFPNTWQQGTVVNASIFYQLLIPKKCMLLF